MAKRAEEERVENLSSFIFCSSSPEGGKKKGKEDERREKGDIHILVHKTLTQLFSPFSGQRHVAWQPDSSGHLHIDQHAPSVAHPPMNGKYVRVCVFVLV